MICRCLNYPEISTIPRLSLYEEENNINRINVDIIYELKTVQVLLAERETLWWNLATVLNYFSKYSGCLENVFGKCNFDKEPVKSNTVQETLSTVYSSLSHPFQWRMTRMCFLFWNQGWKIRGNGDLCRFLPWLTQTIH